MPEALRELGWLVEVDTANPEVTGVLVDSSVAVRLTGRSLLLLRGTYN